MTVQQGQQQADTVNVRSCKGVTSLWIINILGIMKAPKAKHHKSAMLRLDCSSNLFMLQL